MERGRLDRCFRSSPQMNAAPEWADLELSTRSARPARPPFSQMPMDGRFYYEQQGYVLGCLASNYYENARLAQRIEFALIEFEDHDEDPVS